MSVGKKNLYLNGEPLTDAWILSRDIDAPEPKLSYAEVAGADGAIDISTAISDGNMLYNRRELVFEVAFSSEPMLALQRRLGTLYHGKTVQVTTDDAPDTYWLGRCIFSDWQEEDGYVTCTLTVDAEPYRYLTDETTLTVVAASSPGASATLANARMWVSPVVDASAAVTIVTEQASYALAAGDGQHLDGFYLHEGDNPVQVIGASAATVTFRWRQGVL
jgi:hypothetical protein